MLLASFLVNPDKWVGARPHGVRHPPRQLNAHFVQGRYVQLRSGFWGSRLLLVRAQPPELGVCMCRLLPVDPTEAVET